MRVTNSLVAAVVAQGFEAFLKAHKLKSSPELIMAFHAGAATAAGCLDAPKHVVQALCAPALSAMERRAK